MARNSRAEEIIKAFERKAAGEPIVAAVLSPHHSEHGDPDFPTSAMSWDQVCEYVRIADGEYGGPLPLAWTATRVLMPVTHEMTTNDGGWCITVPRDPTPHRFAALFDCDDPEERR